MAPNFTTVDEYAAALPDGVRVVFEQVRATVGRAVPGATETISYQIPAIVLGGRRVAYFAAWQRHIAIYPVPATGPDLERELAPYRSGRGTVRFPLREPMPYPLIERIITALAGRPA